MACDVRNAKVVLYQPLAYSSIIQIVEVNDLKIQQGKDQFFNIEDKNEIVNAILKNISKFANNVIFVSDSEKKRYNFYSQFIPSISEQLTQKNTNINLWKPSHLDLYYGGKKFSKKFLSPDFYNLHVLSTPTMPKKVRYMRMEDDDYFERMGIGYDDSDHYY